MKYNITDTSIEITRNNDMETKSELFDGDIHSLPADLKESELRADIQTLQRVYERANTSANPAIARAYLALERRVIQAFLEREAVPAKKANNIAITTASLKA